MSHAELPPIERKQKMKDSFGFDCSCEACINDYPLENVMRQRQFNNLKISESEKLVKKLVNHLEYKDKKQLQQSFQYLEEIAKKNYPTFEITGLTGAIVDQLQFDQREYQWLINQDIKLFLEVGTPESRNWYPWQDFLELSNTIDLKNVTWLAVEIDYGPGFK